jgi:hypothetical protein
VFADEDRAGLDALAAYVEAAAEMLERQDAATVAAGRIVWPDPAGRV